MEEYKWKEEDVEKHIYKHIVNSENETLLWENRRMPNVRDLVFKFIETSKKEESELYKRYKEESIDVIEQYDIGDKLYIYRTNDGVYVINYLAKDSLLTGLRANGADVTIRTCFFKTNYHRNYLWPRLLSCFMNAKDIVDGMRIDDLYIEDEELKRRLWENCIIKNKKTYNKAYSFAQFIIDEYMNSLFDMRDENEILLSYISIKYLNSKLPNEYKKDLRKIEDKKNGIKKDSTFSYKELSKEMLLEYMTQLKEVYDKFEYEDLEKSKGYMVFLLLSLLASIKNWEQFEEECDSLTRVDDRFKNIIKDSKKYVRNVYNVINKKD